MSTTLARPATSGPGMPPVSVQMIGLSHNTGAPVEVREQIAFTGSGASGRAVAYLAGRRAETGAEFVLVSTCNRTELYVADSAPWNTEALSSLLFALHEVATGKPSAEIARHAAPYLQEQRGQQAVEQVFRVAAGLDSMVIGENDIVRQIKSAYDAAREAGTCGATLNTVFRDSLQVAKRARTETDLGRGAFSIGHVAAELAQSIYGSLRGKSVLVLGAGDMGQITARHLAAAGAATIFVANRTYDTAVLLAEALSGRAVRYDEFPQHLATADVVVASTAATHVIVTRQMVADALRSRAKNRPLYLIDIAVPRNIEPSVGDLDGVYLFDVDHLNQVIESEAAERRHKAARAEAIVREEAAACAVRLRTMHIAGPLVTDVRAWHNAIIQEELGKLKRKLPALDTDDGAKLSELLDGFARTLENKLAHAPTERIKEYATWEDENLAARKMRTVRELFGLEETPNNAEDAKP